MKNTLSDLNNYLFEQLERLNDDSLTDEQLEIQLRKTDPPAFRPRFSPLPTPVRPPADSISPP